MRSQNYSYPLDPDWSVDEMEKVIGMFRVVEDAYEVGVSRQRVLAAYRDFKTVVTAKSEEKRLGRAFEQASGYVLYRVVKAAQTKQDKKIKMVGDK